MEHMPTQEADSLAEAARLARLDEICDQDRERNAPMIRWATRASATCFILPFALYGISEAISYDPKDSTPKEDRIVVASPEIPVQLMGAPCEKATLTLPETKEKAAKLCGKLLNGASIALVNFDSAHAVSQATSDQVAGQLHAATNGRVNAIITAMPASPEANTALDKSVSGKDCIEYQNLDMLASKVADDQMELGVYDLVIGSSGKQVCGGEWVGGVANNSGRHIDLFALPSFFRTARPEDSAAHEILHQFGLGHAGEFVTPQDQALTRSLDYYADHARLREYALTDEVMGNGDERINGPQLHCLDESARAIGRKAPQLNHPLGAEGVSLTARQANESQYVSIGLEDAIAVADEQDRPVYFDQLAVVPLTDPNKSPRLTGYEAVMVNTESCQVATTGKVFVTDMQANAWKFAVGDRTIKIALGKRALTVTSVR